MVSDNYVIIDLETTYSEDYGRVSNQFIETNTVVRCGVLYSTGNFKTPQTYKHASLVSPIELTHSIVCTSDIPKDVFNYNIIVIHNSKFDYLWLLRYHYHEALEWFNNGGILWCTQFTEYMLSGKVAKYNSLDDTAVKYGGTRKYDKIKEYWEAGIKTEDIPLIELDHYLMMDVYNTHKIFKGQSKRLVNKDHLYKSLTGHFDYMVFTGLCEHYGMQVDVPLLDKIREECLQKETELLTELNKILATKIPPEALPYFDFNKNSHVSAILYGGTIKYSIGTPHVYKSGAKAGQTYNKWEHFELQVNGVGLTLDEKTETKVKGVGITESKALAWYTHIPFVKLLNDWRHVKQLLKTFLDPEGNGVRGLVHPDSRLHGYLGHVGTATGRLNSSRPCLQNIDKKSPIRTAFPSRFKDGYIVEIDWSGLENSTTAHITQDENLIHDLHHKLDLHSKRASMINHIDYDVFVNGLKEGNQEYAKMRQKAKTMGFARAYGAGVKNLMETTGLPKKEVKEFIDADNALYPNVNRYYDDLYAECLSKAKATDRFTKEGNRIQTTYFLNGLGWPIAIDSADSPVWMLQAEAVRLLGRNHPYTIKLQQLRNENQRAGIYPVPKEAIEAGMRFTSFTTTVFKNYPNQNLASEIVALFASFLLTNLMNDIILGNVCPINTIHDSYVFDVKGTYLEVFKDVIQTCESEFPTFLQKEFGFTFSAALRLEIKAGRTWKVEE